MRHLFPLIIAGIGALTLACPTAIRHKTIVESIVSPGIQVNHSTRILMMPTQWHRSHFLQEAKLSDRQQIELFGGRLLNAQLTPIFEESGSSKFLTPLQEKQLLGHFVEAFSKRGFKCEYVYLQKDTASAQGESFQHASSRSTPTEESSLTGLPLSEGPLLPENLSINDTLSGMILQASFWQLTGEVARPESKMLSNNRNSNAKAQHRTALCIHVTLWDKPENRVRRKVWAGTVLRASTRPNLKEETAGMIHELMTKEGFPPDHSTPSKGSLSQQPL